jgi:tRNA threonylcarbamoyl adenosine modification protein (Sua5/YciO/YrdC/YwlC family)
MKRIPVDHTDTPSRLCDVLSAGGVVVVPTDTLYGLSASISNRRGYERIVSVKGSGAGRRFLYLAAGVDMVELYIEGWGCASRRVLERVWPAPLTGVFRSGGKSPGWVGETVAFRVPLHARLRAVIGALGEPILSTSINEAGEAPLGDVDVIEERFGASLDLIVDAGPLVGAVPSTLVDFTGDEPVVLRKGGYDWAGSGNPSK